MVRDCNVDVHESNMRAMWLRGIVAAVVVIAVLSPAAAATATGGGGTSLKDMLEMGAAIAIGAED